MTISIVPFQKEEQEEVYRFCISIYDELNWDKKYMDGLDNLAAYFGKTREIFFLAKENNKIIGCGGIKELSSEEGLLKRFYIDKACRGKGVAKQILEKVIAFAKEKNYSSLVLDTRNDNYQAQHFYEKNGFVKYVPKPIKDWTETSNPKMFQFQKLTL